MKQDLVNDGFHRKMVYGITIIASFRDHLPSLWPYKDCYISLHQPLPAGIYANPDELDDLNRSHRLYAVTKKTNVELPTHLAEPNTAYVFQKIEGAWFETWLPLHARYHKAYWFGGYVVNEIEKPQMYMRCPDHQLEHCMNPMVPYKFLCTIHSDEKCIWKKIPFVVSTKSPVSWQTPIGDLNHYYPVAIVTTTVVIIGSIYLVFSINKAKCYMLDYDYTD
ncbi:unnamed protein product [Arctia plantaginis]|uniref:Phosphatidylinositol-glycan biosynthesis class X protein n=1 Tax=Arctia plantaginis TaxID=874455 RepID=A0A8S1BRI4_ARCPL|nr:unnamed protein product [Arctia plantaginis]